MTRCFTLMCAMGLFCARQVSAQGSLTVEQVLSAPFPANLVAAKTGSRIAWTLNQEGKRNIWVAEGPGFSARQLTSYNSDDGGELEHLRFSEDGAAIVYARGEGKNSAGEFGNPTSNPAGAEQAVWWIPFNGGARPRLMWVARPKFPSQVWSLTRRVGRLGWRRSSRVTSRDKSLCAERISRWLGPRTAGACCFCPTGETIASSGYMMWPRKASNLSHLRWISTVIPYGRSTGKCWRSCGSLRRSEIHRTDTSSNRTVHTLGRFGLAMRRRERRVKSGTATRRRMVPIRTWREKRAGVF